MVRDHGAGFQSENLKAFFDGYLHAYDNGFRSYEDLYGIAYSWVAWLEYNILRALGIASAREEKIRLGEAEVRNTIGRIKYLHEIEGEVKKVLEELPSPDPKCMRPMMITSAISISFFEGGLSDIPEYPLPQGYRYVNYRPGDKDAWIDIELSSGEVLSKDMEKNAGRVITEAERKNYLQGCSLSKMMPVKRSEPPRHFTISIENQIRTKDSFTGGYKERSPGERDFPSH